MGESHEVGILLQCGELSAMRGCIRGHLTQECVCMCVPGVGVQVRVWSGLGKLPREKKLLSS